MKKNLSITDSTKVKRYRKSRGTKITLRRLGVISRLKAQLKLGTKNTGWVVNPLVAELTEADVKRINKELRTLEGRIK